MSAEILKEFLVGLGFKVDGPGLKRFTQGVEAATKVATRLGAATTTAALAVEAGVIKISRQFEDLYYASQRIGSSVQNILAMDYAVTQMGGSAQGARAAMEGVASLIRSNPGGENFIRALGVETRDASGNLRDMAEIIRSLGDRFRAMPYYMAKVRANMLGIDEPTLQALIRGTDEFSDRYAAMAQRIGVDQEAAAKASHDFMVAVRDLKVQLELLVGKLLLTLQNSAMLQRVVGILGPIFEALGRLAARVAQWFGAADEATGGWSTALLVLFGILAPIVAILGPTVAGVIALVAAIAALIDDFQTWREGGKSLIDWQAWNGEITRVIGAIRNLLGALEPLFSWVVKVGAAFLEWLGPKVGNVAHAFLESLAGGLNVVAGMIRTIVALLRGDWAGAWRAAQETGKAWLEGWGNVWEKLTGKRDGGPPPVAPAAPGGAGRPAGPSSTAPGGAAAAGGVGAQAMAYFMSKGWTREQAAGIVANLARESSFRHQAVGDNGKAYGLAQWHPDRQEAFRRWAGKDIRQSSFMEQLAFVNHELTRGMERRAGDLLRAANSAAKAGEIVSRYYERPKDASGEAMLRGRMAENWFARANVGQSSAATQVAMNQKTDIHIHGVTDPQAAGRATAGHQERVNGDLVRNMRGAVR